MIARSEEMKTVRRVGEQLIKAARDHVANHMMYRDLELEECEGEVKVKVDHHHKESGILTGCLIEKGVKLYTINMGGNRTLKVDRKLFQTEEDVSRIAQICISTP